MPLTDRREIWRRLLATLIKPKDEGGRMKNSRKEFHPSSLILPKKGERQWEPKRNNGRSPN